RLPEEGEVELIAIAERGAEQTNGAVGIVEQEAANIAAEELRADAHRGEVVVRAEIGELRLDEVILQREEAALPLRALADVRVDDSQFVDVDDVVIHDRRNHDTPINRLVSPVAVEQVEGQHDEVILKEQVWAAEELLAMRARRALERRRTDRHL